MTTIAPRSEARRPKFMPTLAAQGRSSASSDGSLRRNRTSISLISTTLIFASSAFRAEMNVSGFFGLVPLRLRARIISVSSGRRMKSAGVT
ncbi:hypothetical protein D3C72_2153040 [compost metagenome]